MSSIPDDFTAPLSPQEEADALLAWFARTEEDTLAWLSAARDDSAILAMLRAR